MTQQVFIDDDSSANEFLAYLLEEKPDYKITNNRIITKEYDALVNEAIFEKIKQKLVPITPSKYDNTLIYGKDTTEGIISIEVKDDLIFLFLHNGEIIQKPMVYWMLSPHPLDKHFYKLEGNLHYGWMRIFRSKEDYYATGNRYKDRDLFRVWNDVEMAQIYYGFTLFKGLKLEDISVLSFDIESAGLAKDANSEVFLITNTLYKNGEVTRKHFRLDHYDTSGQMISEWCSWVVANDPLVINGHNIYGYDLPYISYVAEKQGVDLMLGKYGEPIRYNKKSSKFRVDGNQDWEYHKASIFGRHIVDGMFLAVRYGVGKEYESWGLKPLAEAENMIKPGRQFYDGALIAKNWFIPEEREKIISYGIDDSDDSYNLFKLMIPSLFYMTQYVPKSLQTMCTSASGSQLNGIMVRSYLQNNHSIPKADEKETVSGGMSYGWPGVYRNVTKWDAKSYYPSTILKFKISNTKKDPKNYFLEMVEYFTLRRFEQKDEYTKTKDKYYDDLQSASKTFINSAYGLLSTTGLNFNSFEHAKLTTRCARAGLQKAVIWATGKTIHDWWPEYKDSSTASQDFLNNEFIDTQSQVKTNELDLQNFVLVNLDTDSLSICKSDHSPFSKEDLSNVKRGLNSAMYCSWADDGFYEIVLVAKAKNYCLYPDPDKPNKIKKKGASLKDKKREPALLEMLDKCIKCLMFNDGDLHDIYHSYIKEAYNIKDINRWASKKSVTNKVLTGTRTNETKVMDAIGDSEVQEGDKIWVYSAINGIKQASAKGELVFLKKGIPKMVENCILKQTSEWSGDENKLHYVERVYKTLCILENVIDINNFIKYHSKKNLDLLEDLCKV